MKLKKLILALAGLGITGSAFALTPLAVNGFNNPNSCSNWIIGGGVAYLQPLGNDLDYANTYNFQSSNGGTVTGFGQVQDSATLTNIQENSVDQEFGWGWMGLVDYRFPQTSNDIELNYLHFDEDDSDDASNTTPFHYIQSTGTGNFFDNVKGSLDTDFDAANLEAGHTFNDGRLGIRVHGGVQYARISSDLSIDGNTPDTFLGYDYQEHRVNFQSNENYDSDSDFHGIGPRVGIGATFDLGSGFSIYGDSGLELLVGDIDTDSSVNNSFTYTTYSFNGDHRIGSYTQNNNVDFDGDDQTTVVPGGDAEAGISYTAPLGNNVGLTVQGGYMVQGYVHPVRRVQFASSGNAELAAPAVGQDSGSCTSTHSTLSDFGDQGPYIGVDLSF